MNSGEIIIGGQLWLAMPVALLAGLISFLSPCVLPLVPGYLGFLGGFAPGAERLNAAAPGPSEAARQRRRLLLGVALFVLGFTVVFVSIGFLFGSLGLLLRTQWLDVITRVAGALVIVMGLVFVGRFTFLQRTFKPSWTPATGLIGAPLLGVVFALGWTPCIGPVLTAVYSLSLNTASPGRAVLLAVTYCIGLGLPFLLVALGFNWSTKTMGFLRRHIRVINIIGGSILILIGVLMLSGLWNIMINDFQGVIGSYVPAL